MGHRDRAEPAQHRAAGRSVSEGEPAPVAQIHPERAGSLPPQSGCPLVQQLAVAQQADRALLASIEAKLGDISAKLDDVLAKLKKIDGDQYQTNELVRQVRSALQQVGTLVPPAG